MVTSTTWQLERGAAERYEEILVPSILGPAAAALVEWSDVKAGESVLDVGCGTGAAARYATEWVGPSGKVIGLDVNPGMIAVAGGLPPVSGAPLEWRTGSVYELPFPPGAMDVVLCAQTLQFLNQRQLALAEMNRVLREGGRVVLSSWCRLEENPYFHALVKAISSHIGSDTAAGLGAAFGLSDPEEIRRLLQTAGFQAIEVTAVTLNQPLPPLATFVPRHISATPMAAGYQAASGEAQQAVVAQMVEVLSTFITDEGLRIPFCTYLARGRRGKALDKSVKFT